MLQNNLHLDALAEIDVFVRYVETDRFDPGNQHETHIHRECEIYVNLSGDVTFEVENRIYPIQRGSVIITRPYEYHHCIYHSEQPHRHYWVLLGGAAPDPLFQLFYDREKGADNLIQLSEPALTELMTHLDSLLQPSTSAFSHRLALLRAIQILSDPQSQDLPVQAAPLSSDVLSALRYMDTHLNESVNWQAVAAHCFVSINTLERHFKQTLQITPSAMLRKKRLIHSAKLLRQGVSVSDACERSGFSDYSGYIAVFRRFFGVTPLQYQKSFEKQ